MHPEKCPACSWANWVLAEKAGAPDMGSRFASFVSFKICTPETLQILMAKVEPRFSASVYHVLGMLQGHRTPQYLAVTCAKFVACINAD